MDTADITLEVLRSIRDEVRDVKGEVHALGGRIGSLERRQLEAELRLSTEMVSLAGVVREVRDAIRDDRGYRSRVDQIETRVAALEKRDA